MKNSSNAILAILAEICSLAISRRSRFTAAVWACCLIASVAAYAQPREWTFAADGKMKVSGGGQMSFRQGGRVDAEYLRSDGTNVVVKMLDGSNATVSLADLSKRDQEHVAKLGGAVADEGAAAAAAEARRNEVAAKLQKEAAAVRAANSPQPRYTFRQIEAIARRETQLGRFEALLDGKPPKDSDEASDYASARVQVERVAAGSSAYAQDARAIADLANKATDLRAAGKGLPFEERVRMIDLIEKLQERGALRR